MRESADVKDFYEDFDQILGINANLHTMWENHDSYITLGVNRI